MARCCICRLSLCLSFVCNVCIVAKQYLKNCLKKQTGLNDRYSVVPVPTIQRFPFSPTFSPKGGTDCTLNKPIAIELAVDTLSESLQAKKLSC